MAKTKLLLRVIGPRYGFRIVLLPKTSFVGIEEIFWQNAHTPLK